ncbi:MAG: hypothetical protein GF416_06655 [Candidatus Altiarchaeales archaeon]|nr:hypothetical protein [Candidatus Altiarchaeales archaeon]MBD3416793.1 hypothetical protein [Candidatus Altiarchaeales archaeon]
MDFCSIDKWFDRLYTLVEEEIEDLLERALPEHIRLFRRLLRDYGLSWGQACRILRENGR